MTEAIGGVRPYNILFSKAFTNNKYTALAMATQRFFNVCVLVDSMNTTDCTFQLKNWSSTEKHSHQGFTALVIGS